MSRIFVFLALFLSLFCSSVQAVEYIEANFETLRNLGAAPLFVVGQPVPLGPNFSDRPWKIDPSNNLIVGHFLIENLSHLGRSSLNTGNFLRIMDEDPGIGTPPTAYFDLFDRSFKKNCVRVSWDALFEENENYFFSYDLGHFEDPNNPISLTLAKIETNVAGELQFSILKNNVLALYSKDNYQPDHRYRFETYLDLNRHLWAVLVNGKFIFNDAEIPNSPFGLLRIGYQYDHNTTGIMQVDNVKVVPLSKCIWPKPLDSCNLDLPDPILLFSHVENVVVNGEQYARYRFKVKNYDLYPDALFAPSPDLPPCGLNTNSSRTWVHIERGDAKYIYGFCAFYEPNDLNYLWFSERIDQQPPDAIRIVMYDRFCGRAFVSNTLNIIPQLVTIHLTIFGHGRVRTSDNFICINSDNSPHKECILRYAKGQEVTFRAEALDNNFPFLRWEDGCQGDTNECTINFNEDTNIKAFFLTVGDVNGDGSLSIIDALLIARCALRLDSNCNLSIADLNCNNVIDIVDALLIARKALGLPYNNTCSSE